ncbi:MAG: lipoprotein signal peptidase [Bacteroidota bacterium]|jgi:signal peptidase II
MKNKFLYYPIIIGLLLLIIDQWSKFYIKTHFNLSEEVNVFGDWFKLHFLENYGMAFGIEFGGSWGKIVLTMFRIIFCGVIIYYISSLIKAKTHLGYTISWTMILVGALGNIIDSVFYGVFFSKSDFWSVAQFLPADGGYATWFHGSVVDMLYFPIIKTHIPSWFPFWSGESFEFFRPVFNVADATISIGFVLILLFQKSFSEQSAAKNEEVIVEDEAISNKQ